MRALLILLALSVAPAVPVHANGSADEDASCEAQPEQRTRNRDGSVLGLSTECPAPGIRRHLIQLYCEGGRHCDQLQIEQESEYSRFGNVALIDLDGDGNHEVEVRGGCGVGPNCEGDVYRVDHSGRKLQHFFSGGYAELSINDGWLLEAGRASCCSWEYHGWELSRSHELPLHYGNMDLMVEVGMQYGESDDYDCRFSVVNGDNRVVVAPPSPALEHLCELYGEGYRLTPPEFGPGARPRRQEQ
jgi:hypothetical protein